MPWQEPSRIGSCFGNWIHTNKLMLPLAGKLL